MRMGALAAAAVLLVPVVMAVAADDGGSGDEVRTEAGASTVVTTLAPQSESTVQPGVIEITAAVRPVPAEVGDDAEDTGDEASAAAEALGEKGSPDDTADDAAAGDEPAAAVAEAVELEAASEPECAGSYRSSQVTTGCASSSCPGRRWRSG